MCKPEEAKLSATICLAWAWVVSLVLGGGCVDSFSPYRAAAAKVAIEKWIRGAEHLGVWVRGNPLKTPARTSPQRPPTLYLYSGADQPQADILGRTGIAVLNGTMLGASFGQSHEEHRRSMLCIWKITSEMRRR